MTALLLTGAGGRLAQHVRPSLRREFDLVRLFDRAPMADVADGEEPVIGDLADFDAVQRACAGVGTVVHLGGKADEAEFPEILSANIIGTQHVFEAARQAGVTRIVFASSHHVTGCYPPDVTVGVDAAVRPDTYYGVSKVFGEALGRLYHDKWGLEVVCLRIGVCRAEPENSDQLRTWLSGPDSARLVVAAATAELNEGFVTVYGFSDNSRSFWRREPAAAIGFRPQDSADAFADRFGDAREYSFDRQGGGFAVTDYRGGLW